MATVKEINHDSSTTLSDFYDTISDPNARLSVIPGAALNSSTNGLSVNNTIALGFATLTEGFTVLGTNEFRWRLYCKVSGITVSSGSNTIFVSWLLPSGGNAKYGFKVATAGVGSFTASAEYRKDGAGFQSVGPGGSISAVSEVCLELRVVRETADGNNDGIIEFLIDGVSIDLITDAETFNEWTLGGSIDEVHNQFPNSSNYTGNCEFDEWILNDDDSADLGCSASFSGYDLVLGGGQP